MCVIFMVLFHGQVVGDETVSPTRFPGEEGVSKRCKAFDSVNQDALWRMHGLRGMPPKLINLMSELNSGTESAVRCGDTTSDLFPVVAGVCQGCVLPTRTFQHLSGLDSGEGVREIKLQCII